jgi:septal ring factor EnvC (AmiA/AmiB activator)
LEQQALRRADALTGQSMDAGDVAIASGEEAGLLQRQGASQKTARQLAAELAKLPAIPPRAGKGSRQPAVGIAYALPVDAPLMAGLGEVSPVGIRSRGLVFRAWRGAPVVVPAAGRVAFAGPFRSREGVVILDHGGGWMTLLTGVRTRLAVGSEVAAGAPLGRALGEVGVELSHGGRAVSPALMAGSSAMLSNAPKRG